MLNEFFPKYLKKTFDSAKFSTYPIFRLEGCQLIASNVHLYITLELNGLWIVAVTWAVLINKVALQK